MNHSLEAHDPSFDFLFEAAAEGLELQKQINQSDHAAHDAMSMAVAGFQAKGEADVDVVGQPSDLVGGAAKAVGLVAGLGSLRKSLTAKEKEIDEQLANTPLSVRILPGEGRRLIVNTYFSSGAVGSRQQEFGTSERTHRNGTFRAALLGHNALILYPQWMSGQQMDRRSIMALILRDDGTPNLSIKQRERTWRDKFGPHFPIETILLGRRPISTAESYERWTASDVRRLKELAVDL